MQIRMCVANTALPVLQPNVFRGDEHSAEPDRGIQTIQQCCHDQACRLPLRARLPHHIIYFDNRIRPILSQPHLCWTEFMRLMTEPEKKSLCTKTAKLFPRGNKPYINRVNIFGNPRLISSWYKIRTSLENVSRHRKIYCKYGQHKISYKYEISTALFAVS